MAPRLIPCVPLDSNGREIVPGARVSINGNGDYTVARVWGGNVTVSTKSGGFTVCAFICTVL